LKESLQHWVSVVKTVTWSRGGVAVELLQITVQLPDVAATAWWAVASALKVRAAARAKVRSRVFKDPPLRKSSSSIRVRACPLGEPPACLRPPFPAILSPFRNPARCAGGDPR
jgi:hypothetical protein